VHLVKYNRHAKVQRRMRCSITKRREFVDVKENFN